MAFCSRHICVTSTRHTTILLPRRINVRNPALCLCLYEHMYLISDFLMYFSIALYLDELICYHTATFLISHSRFLWHRCRGSCRGV